MTMARTPSCSHLPTPNALPPCIAERITQKVTHALMRYAAELLEQSAVKSKVRQQHLGNRVGNRECEMTMRHAARIDSASIAPNICTFF